MQSQDLSKTILADLIHDRLPPAEALKVLDHLTPASITPTDFETIIQLLQETAISLPLLPKHLTANLMDCCGTGGSGMSVFNTSTATAFVLAAGGVPVIKFGNRAITSQSGSFDFLDVLGIASQSPVDLIPHQLTETGLVFLYAPQCYPGLGPLQALRKQYAAKTVFNFVGPLLNPYYPPKRLLGVSDRRMISLIARFLEKQSLKKLKNSESPEVKTWIVHSATGSKAENNESFIGLDEFSVFNEAAIYKIFGNSHSPRLEYAKFQDPDAVFQPTPFLKQFGFHAHASEKIQSLDPKDSAQRFLEMIHGNDQQTHEYNMLCLNAAAGFCIAGIQETMDEGFRLAASLLSSGAVLKKLNTVKQVLKKGL
ncbi:MAG: anthranilate phosphoribosyltransferase [Cyanobacteria bacterium P01_H01_bin.74]